MGFGAEEGAHAVMHTDLVVQRMGAERMYEGPAAVAAWFDGAQGAAPATFELIADPECCQPLDVVPAGAES